jgi:hypothetical protein
MNWMRALTWIDLAICAALAIPFLAPVFLGLLSDLSGLLGSNRLAVPNGMSAFFVNLAGLFGVLWNIVMLTREDRALHLIDMGARAGVIALILWHMSFSGLAPVFTLFIGTELLGGVVKWHWLKKTKPVAAP